MKGLKQVTNANDTTPISVPKIQKTKQENKNIIPTISQNEEEKIREQEPEIEQLKKINQQQERENEQLKRDIMQLKKKNQEKISQMEEENNEIKKQIMLLKEENEHLKKEQTKNTKFFAKIR